MKKPSLDSMLLSSTDPERLHAWYIGVLEPEESSLMDGYRIARYGGFHLIFDTRADIGKKNPEPGRMILNFDVADARAIVARLDEMGVKWLAPLEDRDGSLWATAIDPDGNYVQVIQLSDQERSAMAEGSTAEADPKGGNDV